MARVRRLRGKVLWAPAGAVAVVGALLAGTMFASAAAPSLPSKTPAQLLAAMRHAKLPPAMTAVISESADLGFPALPDIAGLPSSALSAASWLAGSHTIQIWYSGPRHVRIAVPVSFGETDLRVNGSQVWLWQSQGQVATHIIPAGPVVPLWRISHLRPAQIAHIPAFLQQRVHISASAPPVPAGQAPAQIKQLLRKLRAAQAKGVPIPAMCAAPRGWWMVPFRAVHMTPAKVRALMKSRARAIAKMLHAPIVRAIRISMKMAKVHSTLAVPPRLAVGAVKAVTPLQAAQRLLAMLGPTTKVSIAGTTVVAGRPAYQLSIEPRSDQSLIGQILIAVDGTSYLPLQVQVIPRGSSSPAFQIGFTTFTPGQPAASNFAFTPPPGAHVHVVRLPNPLAGLMGLPGISKFSVKTPLRPLCSRHLRGETFAELEQPCRAFCDRGVTALPQIATIVPAGPRVLGGGWLSVLEIPAGQALAGLADGSRPVTVKPGAHGSPVPIAGGQAMAMLRTLLNSATQVHGAWGSGKLISTKLVNILITSKGQVLVGAVTPAVLYADAAKVS